MKGENQGFFYFYMYVIFCFFSSSSSPVLKIKSAIGDQNFTKR